MTNQPMPSCEFNSQELMLRLDVVVAADVDAICPVVERVMEIARDMKCTEGKEFEIEMALREALANAIVHGARHDASKHVQLCVVCDNSRGMLIVVRDPGAGFDPASVPSPVVGQNVFSEHGRGIYLINQLMDEVRFERGGTEIRMKKF
ncbi:MAG: ATP-binding protein [Acidobacteria bacterium]|nr:ATP-binding protein [Acidobacteriota bacterium]MBI3662257.1 ATP-binding protein [Acidobacteriota bacterium]